MNLFLGPTRTRAFFQHRPFTIDSAYGYMTSLSLLDEKPMREVYETLPKWLEKEAIEMDSAWEEYLHCWLVKNDGSPFPRWHEVEGRLNWVLGMQNMSDYMHLVENHFKSQAGWTQVDHVVAFILRLQAHRMLCETGLVGDPRRTPEPWSKATRWAAAFVMSDMLHWFQVQWQRDEISKNRRGRRVQRIIDMLEKEPHVEGTAYSLYSQKPSSLSWDPLEWISYLF
jgi:hypothetical protein